MSRDFRATYRLQLTPDFGFREARALVPYLERLGVSHLYLSPSFQAREGSTHGYDVTDPRRVSEPLGGEEELRALAAEGLGIVLDIVPNHMAAADENPFWADADLRRTFFDLDTRTGLHRRFFDIGDLAGVRVEDEAVFATTHEKAFELVREGVVDGLRIDHIDGLANPREYLDRLAREGVEHVWVEKILEPGERLRAWPVDGTTGYEFLNDVMHLFLNPRAEEPLTRLYEELTGDSRTFEEVAGEAKLEQATGTFEPELRRLYESAGGVENLAQALASFHVYRTYVEPEGDVVADEDRFEIARAALAESLERILLLDEHGHDDFVRRFQQTTGPVMAKGVEDTTFYRYNRFVALNEVGGNPGAWTLPVDTFHLANIERADRFPRHLLTAFTHDTKRSPDVRARLVALTWHADEWEELARRELDFPDRNEGYFALQTLVGAWPIEHERIDAYFEKAFRESKLRTNWLDPDEEWEGRIKDWARSKRDIAGVLAERVRAEGERISLAMLVLRLASPGVPDIYQGDEAEALALVDPDNRRPVDWNRLAQLLEEDPLREPKQWVTSRLLGLRRTRPQAFAGGYMPVAAAPDVCAFMRGPDVLVVVPLAPSGSPDVDVAGDWQDVLEERFAFRVYLRRTVSRSTPEPR
ncbi:MAG: alpha-amylase family glycosyl hydrolase [Gaiellaceae bacterium]